MKIKFYTIIFLCGLLLLSTITKAANYTYTIFGNNYAPSTSAFAYGINDSGQVVGELWYNNTVGFIYNYNNLTYTKIVRFPGALQTWAQGINNNGQIVGFYYGKTRGFFYSSDTYTTLSVPNADATWAYGINGSGQVVGKFLTGTTYHGFIYSGGIYTTLDAPNAISTIARGINDSGQITGSFSDGTGGHGFVYSGGTYTTLDVPNASSTNAYGINNSGQVAGTFSDGTSTHGFVYSGGTYTTLDVPKANGTWTYTSAYGINNSGQVVGTYSNPTGLVNSFVATPTINQTITFGTVPTVIVGGTGTVTATGGASGNPVTFSSTTPGVCTVSGSTVTGVSVGACTIAANQAGNANYNAATQATQTFTVDKGKQTIIFGTAPLVVFGGTGMVKATGGASGNPVTFSSQTTGVCTVSGSTVTGVLAGRCTIAAFQVGNLNYNDVLHTQSFDVTQINLLSVSNANSAKGTVTSDTGGIICGATCSSNFANGTPVKLTAIPISGYQFSGWGGNCVGYGNSCILTMDTAKTVTASFDVFKKKRRPSWFKAVIQ